MKRNILMGALLGSLVFLALPQTSRAQGVRSNSVAPRYNVFYGNSYRAPYYGGWNYGNPYYYYPYFGTNYYQPWVGAGYDYPYGWDYYSSPGFSFYSSVPYISYSPAPGYSPTPMSLAGENSIWPGTYETPDKRNGDYRQSFYPVFPRDDGTSVPRPKAFARAYVRVSVPAPDANVWINNTPTQLKGLDRLFEALSLERGKKAKYTIKASWIKNGQQVTQERNVEIAGGRDAVVVFGGESADPKPPASPRPLPQAPREQSTQIVFGKVISTSKRRLVIANVGGGNERTFAVGPNVPILEGSVPTSLDELQRGTRVQLTLQPGSANVVTRVDAAPEQVVDQGHHRPYVDRSQPAEAPEPK